MYNLKADTVRELLGLVGDLKYAMKYRGKQSGVP